jgi:hypothetical protein
MVMSLPGGIDDTAPRKTDDFQELVELVETLVELYETKPTQTLVKKITPEIKSLETLARGRGTTALDQVNALKTRFEAAVTASKKVTFPIKTQIYAHNDKESNWHKAEELGLNGEAAKTFAYTGLEVEFDVLVAEDGSVTATHVNGVALVEPVGL